MNQTTLGREDLTGEIVCFDGKGVGSIRRMRYVATLHG